MAEAEPLTKSEIIGRRVGHVFHVDLKYDVERQFQSRFIVVELNNGLLFQLEQRQIIIDPASNVGLLFPYSGAKPTNIALDPAVEKNLQSPIRHVLQPYGWDRQFGLLLENGFVLHDGFSSWDNGVLFYHPGPEEEDELKPFDLPAP